MLKHSQSSIIQNFKLKWVRSVLISPRHGERGNEITEAFYFRAHWWRRLFKKNGWRVANEQPSQLFYSGNILFGTLVSLQTRKKLSYLLGSSTRLFKIVRLIDWIPSNLHNDVALLRQLKVNQSSSICTTPQPRPYVKHKSSRVFALVLPKKWYGWSDSNRHSVTRTGFWIQRVYQFRHTRIA